WQHVLVARSAKRPFTLDYIQLAFTDFIELHGDRADREDAAIVGGWARLDGETVMIIGQQRGRDTKEILKRNFGMPHPEGYHKATAQSLRDTLIRQLEDLRRHRPDKLVRRRRDKFLRMGQFLE